MALLGTRSTWNTGITPGTVPAATLARTGRGSKLRLDLGQQTIMIALGADPRAALTALRDDLDVLLTEEAV